MPRWRTVRVLTTERRRTSSVALSMGHLDCVQGWLPMMEKRREPNRDRAILPGRDRRVNVNDRVQRDDVGQSDQALYSIGVGHSRGPRSLDFARPGGVGREPASSRCDRDSACLGARRWFRAPSFSCTECLVRFQYQSSLLFVVKRFPGVYLHGLVRKLRASSTWS